MKKLQLSVITLVILSVLFLGCERSLFFISGHGDIVTQTLTLSDFDAIENNESINIVITQGDSQEVIAEGHQNIIDRLKLDVVNHTWKIDLIRGNYRDFELTIYITVPTLTDVKLNGSGDVKINTFQNLTDLGLEINGSGNIENTENISAENISVEISGSGYCQLNAIATKIESQISGSGNISLSGIISNQVIEINGSGQYSAFDCLSDSADVRISGSGDTEISVNNLMDVDISGSGNVYYKGTPVFNINITGSGSVMSKN
jgi:hypothetical protein